MNLDKLKSLIRLANNNPNENEANLAARKVCKIIAEENFKLLNGNSHQPQQQFYGRPADRSGVDYASIFEEMLRQDQARRKAKQAEENKKKETNKSDFWGRVDYVYWDDDLGREYEPKQKKDKELYQKCYKCKQMKWGPKPDIAIFGYPLEFHCHDCLKATKGGR